MKQQLYNANWANENEVLSNFIARQNLLEYFHKELSKVPLKGSVQHYLLVGLRGSGKSTMLQRIAVAIRQESSLAHLLGLSFPEELYEIKSLSDFWWACCNSLVDYLELTGKLGAANDLERHIEKLKNQQGEDETQAGLELLQSECATLKKRPVLLVDNLDMLFDSINSRNKNSSDSSYWAFREALSTSSAPLMIAGSVRLSEHFKQYDQAFYEFFLLKYLSKISLEETKQVIKHLTQGKDCAQLLENSQSRINALYEITGGNLRAIGFMVDLLEKNPSGQTVEDFSKLMDITTPYYKARIEDLPLQARVVMNALAVRRNSLDGLIRFGHQAVEIAEFCQLPTNTVSAHLDNLEKEGLVEKSAEQGKMQYRIAEQLFRLWLQMRNTRRIRHNALGLVEFLRAMFDRPQLEKYLEDPQSSPLARSQYAMALAESEDQSARRYSYQTHAAENLSQHLSVSGEDVKEYLSSEDLQLHLAKLFELKQKLSRVKHTLNSSEQTQFIGSVKITIKQKEKYLEQLENSQDSAAIHSEIRRRLQHERQNLLKNGLSEEDCQFLFAQQAAGRLSLPYIETATIDAEVEFKTAKAKETIWRIVGARDFVKFNNEQHAQSWLSWGEKYASAASANEWANVACTMRCNEQLVSAEQALTIAISKGETAQTKYEQAALMNAKNQSPEEVEAAYNQAIAIDENYSYPWNGLGNLYADKLNRYEDAETAYKQAIAIDENDAYPWILLGVLYAENPNRPEEAEAAYKQAIAIDENYATAWNNLGALYADKLNRYEEAEAAYKQAIAIDENYVYAWRNLGLLYANKMNRYEDAEAAYKQAIAIDENYVYAWRNLANLLKNKLNRPEEALAAFDRAFSLDPAPHSYWQAQRNQLFAEAKIKNIREALLFGNTPALRQILSQLQEDKYVADVLVSKQFVEKGLREMLGNPSTARILLSEMWLSGLDKVAKPLIIAFAAAIENKADLLKSLAPELQKATLMIYQRLVE